jgi:ethanolamine utilization protein EutA
VVLQRQSQGLSSRFVVIDREVVWRSPIMLTPFLADGTIDAHELGHFIRHAYHDAGYRRTDIDSGAVILTGEAIKKTNARAIDDLFADEAGKFVCATAGHKLECLLAAHGSGALALSRQRHQRLLHIDIGGGTTKLALIDHGRVVGLCAFAVGGRLIATDAAGAWTRVDDSARLAAEELGIATDPHTLADPAVRQKIAERLARIAVDYILGASLDDLGQRLMLTEPLADTQSAQAFTFSGGVSEYVFGYEEGEYGDIAKMLAAALREELKSRAKVPAIDPGQRIRATVIGASQFTVQVSGKTIYLSDQGTLPVHNIPVVHVHLDPSSGPDEDTLTSEIEAGLRRLDLDPGARMAIAFSWGGDPEYSLLETTGRAILRAVAPDGARNNLLALVIDGDVGRTLGRLLHLELGLSSPLVSLDGLQLQEFDFVDIGELADPPGVVPVVIKSLLFS